MTVTDERRINPWLWPLIALGGLVACVLLGTVLALVVTA